MDNTNILDKIQVDEKIPEDIIKSKRILELKELKKENDDIVGWIEIDDTNISYPVCKLMIMIFI